MLQQPSASDEGSRRLPKHLKFVTLLASVYEPHGGYMVVQWTTKAGAVSLVGIHHTHHDAT